MDVALHGGIVFGEVLCLPLVERAGGLECLLEVFWACASPVGLRYGSAVGCGHHLLPVALLVLIPLIAAALGQSGVIAIVPTAEVAGSFGLATEVRLDSLLVGGVQSGDVQELSHCA